jgi:Zn-dependent M28 family amino/carboxypeptidase
VSVGIDSRLSRSALAGNNVVGVLPGAGPEAVVLTAHLDHLGIGRVVDGDSVYNGAVDNGTALAVLLGLAQGYARTSAASHPTLVFVAADAEEEGLLGSIYQTRHPAVPLERTLAAINFEISNPWGLTRDVLVIGAPHAAFARAFAPVLEARHLRLTPDQTPEQGFMFRSDQLAWAQAGIPAAWIDGGTDYVDRPAGWGEAKRAEYRARTYHYPTDDLRADFDYSGLVQLAEITTALVQQIGAGGASAWKSDPELVGMKRPGGVR